MERRRMKCGFWLSAATLCLMALLGVPDGRLKVGGLSVEPGKGGREARVKTIVLSGNESKEEFITMSGLAEFPSLIEGFHYGVSTDNELLLIERDTTQGAGVVGVLQNARGEHDVPSQGMGEWLAGNMTIVKATRAADGRILIGEVPSDAPVAEAPSASSGDSVLTNQDGVDLAIVEAGKQKESELKTELAPMFVDAKGRQAFWPPIDSQYPSYFMQGDMVLNVGSKPLALEDVTLKKGEAAALRKKQGDGGGLAWAKLPWQVTTGRSIWVSLVGDFGRKAGTDAHVYVLSSAEFSQYWAKRAEEETPKLEPRGTAPVLVQGLEPGRYFVGVQYALDLDAIRQTVTLERIDPLIYLEDDVADESEMQASFVKGEDGSFGMAMSSIRWYAVEVASDAVHPVVSLIIPKGASPAERRSLYPSRTQFRIDAPPELKELLWQSLEEATGAKTTPEQRAELFELLARGGRVCVPSAKLPTAVFIDYAGKPSVATRVGFGGDAR